MTPQKIKALITFPEVDHTGLVRMQLQTKLTQQRTCLLVGLLGLVRGRAQRSAVDFAGWRRLVCGGISNRHRKVRHVWRRSSHPSCHDYREVVLVEHVFLWGSWPFDGSMWQQEGGGADVFFQGATLGRKVFTSRLSAATSYRAICSRNICSASW